MTICRSLNSNSEMGIAIKPGISVLTLRFQLPYRPDDSLLQGFKPVWVPGPRSGTGRGRFHLQRARNARKGPFSRAHPQTLPPQTSAVIEICSALYAPYPAGDRNAAIFCSMFPKSRLVRWLWASSNQ
jgi:hypothetical protein